MLTLARIPPADGCLRLMVMVWAGWPRPFRDAATRALSPGSYWSLERPVTVLGVSTVGGALPVTVRVPAVSYTHLTLPTILRV